MAGPPATGPDAQHPFSFRIAQMVDVVAADRPFARFEKENHALAHAITSM
jgi:hypothetical protein